MANKTLLEPTPPRDRGGPGPGRGGEVNPSSRGAYEVLFTPTLLAPHLWRADLGCSNNVLARSTINPLNHVPLRCDTHRIRTYKIEEVGCESERIENDFSFAAFLAIRLGGSRGRVGAIE